MNRLRWFFRRLTRTEAVMSAAWLQSQERLMQRIDYHGPSIQWPICKVQNDAAWRQTRKLKRVG
jgi:hypothetical protein